jgi:hypothetical protein
MIRNATSRRYSLFVAVLLDVLLLAAGCGPAVSTRSLASLDEYNQRHRGSLDVDRFSSHTEETLLRLGLDPRHLGSTASLLRGLEGATVGSEQRLLASAELAFFRARREQESGSPEAAGWFALAAGFAWDYVVGAGSDLGSAGLITQRRYFDPSFHWMLDIYNHSTGRVAALLAAGQAEAAGEPGAAQGPSQLLDRVAGQVPESLMQAGLRSRTLRAGRAGEVELTVEASPQGHGARTWHPEDWQELLEADRILVRGLDLRYHDHGMGAPLVLVRENRGPSSADRYYPPEGVVAPATAVLFFEPEGSTGLRRRAVLRLVDPRAGGDLTLRSEAAGALPAPVRSGRRLPLAADFTAPYAELLGRARLRRLGLQGFLAPDRADYHRGIFLLEPYAPEKIPVLMIHGLLSSPFSFRELTNDLLGDPELRQHYQVWHYVYPTGLPYLYSAAQLRQALAEVRGVLDPEGDDLATESMVLVAHSMGGLLARTLVTDPGQDLWNLAFEVPPEELEGEPEALAKLQELFIFEPASYVQRVIFLATPHRGAESAGSTMAQLGASLVKLPDDLVEWVSAVSGRHGERMTESMRRMFSGGAVNSVDALRPGDPLLDRFGTLRISPHVAAHSILGDRGAGGGAQSSDGYVEYGSAHLPEAASELIVPAGHRVHEHPWAIQEVRRILRRHCEDGGFGDRGVQRQAPRGSGESAAASPPADP